MPCPPSVSDDQQLRDVDSSRRAGQVPRPPEHKPNRNRTSPARRQNRRHGSILRGSRPLSPAGRQSRATNQHVSPLLILRGPWLTIWSPPALCLIPNFNDCYKGFPAKLLSSFNISHERGAFATGYWVLGTRCYFSRSTVFTGKSQWPSRISNRRCSSRWNVS